MVARDWIRDAASWAAKRAALLATGLVLIASLRIVATYRVFSHTFDEPMHVACGMEYLDRGSYACEPQHPPLARVAAALGPYLAGIRSQGIARNDDPHSQPLEGIAVLYAGGHYERNLALARFGVLPFFWLACWSVYAWGRRFDALTALLSLLVFTLVPPVLAHAGLATTDMALTASLTAAFLAALRWAEQPTLSRAALFGLLTGIAVLSKFTTFLFLPAACAATLLVFWGAGGSFQSVGRRHLVGAAAAIGVGAAVIWAGYRFSVGLWADLGLTLPAPELGAGLATVRLHNEIGHWSFLLGQRSPVGFWYFYPVALAVKTPLAFLALTGTGIALIAHKQWRALWIPLVFAAAVLQAGMIGHINIGIRHVLPVYVGASVLAGAALARHSLEPSWHRIPILLLAAWLLCSSALAHPDYIAYFNALAGDHPENILVDSDLDWGQDIKRLGARLRELGVQSVQFPQFIVADLEGHQGFPRIDTQFDLTKPPQTGYFAAGATFWKALRFGLVATDDHPIWLDTIPPTERVGKGMFLWRFPPP